MGISFEKWIQRRWRIAQRSNGVLLKAGTICIERSCSNIFTAWFMAFSRNTWSGFFNASRFNVSTEILGAYLLCWDSIFQMVYTCQKLVFSCFSYAQFLVFFLCFSFIFFFFQFPGWTFRRVVKMVFCCWNMVIISLSLLLIRILFRIFSRRISRRVKISLKRSYICCLVINI